MKRRGLVLGGTTIGHAFALSSLLTVASQAQAPAPQSAKGGASRTP